MNWCLYHPEQPQFLGPITEGRMAGPTGRYPCCGQQAYRYETLSGPTVTTNQILFKANRDNFRFCFSILGLSISGAYNTNFH